MDTGTTMGDGSNPVDTGPAAPGARGGTCRASAPECDPGLACRNGRCVVLVADGSACDPSERTTGCATSGSECVSTGGRDLCVGAGARDGRCRPTGMACDAGLACNGAPTATTSRCRTAVAPGGACDPIGFANACEPPGRCLGGGTAAVCRSVSYRVERFTGATFVDACAAGRRLFLVPPPTGGLENRDDNRSNEAVPIPFDFTLFGERFTSLWPTTNGYASFNMPPTSPASNVYLPESRPEYQRVLAVLSGDLAVRGSPSGDLCVATTGMAPSRRFIVEWLFAYPASRFGDGQNRTFELVLVETTGVIEYVYQRLDGATDPDDFRDTIGMQTSGTAHVRWTGGLFTAGTGIRFTPM